jgi:O-antigen/teichoic acid export membrane protein
MGVHAQPSVGRRRAASLLRQAFVLDQTNLGRRVAHGTGYQFLGMVLRTGVTLVSTAVLARLLAPADFGYIAMASVVTELAALFLSFGLTNILIQRRRISRIQVDTVFWSTLILGAVMALAVNVLALFAAMLFDEPRVGKLLPWMSLNFVLAPLPSIGYVVLSRLMRFQMDFWIQISAAVLRTGVAIAFAIAGFGVWSLVAGALAGVTTQAVLAFVLVPYRPRWRFDPNFLKSTWRTSSSYLGGGILFYVNMNMDLLLIGRWLGATPLGFYQNARSLTDEIRARIALPLQQVLFPAFSSAQSDAARMRQMVLLSVRLLAAVVVPMGFLVAALAQDLVPVLYGDQWRPMIPVLALLGIGVALKASTAVAGPIMNSMDRVGLALRYNSIGTAITLVGIALVLQMGIVAVAGVVTLMSTYWLVAFRVAFGLVGLRGIDVLRTLGPSFAASGAMLGLLELGRQHWGGWLNSPWERLLVGMVLGTGIYLTLLLILSPGYLQDAARVAKLVYYGKKASRS